MSRPNAGVTGQKIALAGSNRVEPEGAVYVGDVDPEQPIVITVYLKRRSPDKFQPGSAGDLARLAKPITRRALAAQRRRTHAHAAARIRDNWRRNSASPCSTSTWSGAP